MDNGGGFQLLYESLDEAPVMSNRSGSCGGDFRTEKGILTSPSYPEIYPRDQSCTYTISQPAGKYVSVKFMAFDIKCNYEVGSDYLEIRRTDAKGNSLLGKWCGNSVPSLMYTTDNNLEIR